MVPAGVMKSPQEVEGNPDLSRSHHFGPQKGGPR